VASKRLLIPPGRRPRRGGLRPERRPSTPVAPGALLAAAALFALPACDAPEAPPSTEWVITVDTTASGTILVTHVPPETGVEPRWTVEPELRIGIPVRTEPDTLGVIRVPEAFELIKGIAPLPDGTIAILDARAQELRLFDVDGSPVRTFGGRGEGPGEFNDANGLVAGPDGRIRVHDPRNARLSVFDPDLGHVHSESIDIMSFAEVWNAVGDEEGRVLESTLDVRNGEVLGAIRVFDVDGRVADTIVLEGRPPPTFVSAERRFEWENDEGLVTEPVPWQPVGFRRLDPRGSYWEKEPDANDHRIVKVSFTGDTLFIVEGGRSPEAVTTSQRDSVIDDLRTRSGGRDLDWSLIPNELPIVRGAFLDDQYRLWIRVRDGEGSTTFDVVGEDGVYQGTVKVPFDVAEMPAPVVIGDRFHAVSIGEDGVAQVVRGVMMEVEVEEPGSGVSLVGAVP
jgi:hypothetical protein